MVEGAAHDTQEMADITLDMAQEGSKGGREAMRRMWGVMERKDILDTIPRLSLRRIIGVAQGGGLLRRGNLMLHMIGRHGLKGSCIGIDWMKDERGRRKHMREKRI